MSRKVLFQFKKQMNIIETPDSYWMFEYLLVMSS